MEGISVAGSRLIIINWLSTQQELGMAASGRATLISLLYQVQKGHGGLSEANCTLEESK